MLINRNLVGAVVVVFATATSLPASGECLFANPTCTNARVNCADDTLSLSKRPNVVKALAGLGISSDSVRFRSCVNGCFSAAPRPDGTFLITYPAVLAKKDLEAIDAPILHELGHILQLKIAGNIDALSKSLDGARRELGADFLAGFQFQRYLGSYDYQLFASNLHLLGQYDTVSDYGRPEQRNSAFRLGVNLPGSFKDAADAHRQFQKNLFKMLEIP